MHVKKSNINCLFIFAIVIFFVDTVVLILLCIYFIFYKKEIINTLCINFIYIFIGHIYACFRLKAELKGCWDASSPAVDRNGPVLSKLLLGFMHLSDEVDEALS